MKREKNLKLTGPSQFPAVATYPAGLAYVGSGDSSSLRWVVLPERDLCIVVSAFLVERG